MVVKDEAIHICRYEDCGETFEAELDAFIHLAYGHQLLERKEKAGETKER